MAKKRAKVESELVDVVQEEGEPTLDDISDAMSDLTSTTDEE